MHVKPWTEIQCKTFSDSQVAAGDTTVRTTLGSGKFRGFGRTTPFNLFRCYRIGTSLRAYRCHRITLHGRGLRSVWGLPRPWLAQPKTLHKGKMKTVMMSRRHLLIAGDAYREAGACHMLFFRNKNPCPACGNQKVSFLEKPSVGSSSNFS